MSSEEKRVPDYKDGVQEVEEFTLRTCEYRVPFNYENIEVNRRYYHGAEFHGVELNPTNAILGESKSVPGDSIVIRETAPIVRLVVMGSACTPPGYVMVECEPEESFYREDEMRTVMPLRFRISNLWGMHMRADQWWCWGKADELRGEATVGDYTANQGGRAPYEPMPQAILEEQKNWAPHGTVKGHSRENPLAGMSCAIFEIPKSRQVRITGGSEPLAWSTDNYPEDAHYSFRIIRTTVLL